MAVEAHRFFVPVGVVAMPTEPVPVNPGETYFDTTLGQLRTWDGVQWLSGSRGPAGPEGPEGPPGTVGASTDPGNAVIIDASGNIYVPDEVIIAAGPTGPASDNLEIWIDHASTDPVIDTYSRNEADATFVNIDGDTMTGRLYLVGDPTGPTEAATKQYVDANSGGGGTGGLDQTAADERYVNIDGDAMTGALLLPTFYPADPLEAAAKAYVDSRIWYGSQSEYNAIVAKDPSVLYCIGI